jgi:voltage-gated potassium channel Kch
MVEEREEQLELIAAQIAGLDRHYIICGLGRTGYYIIERLFEIRLPFVVIEQDLDVLADLKIRLHERAEKLLYLEGDATEEETLEKAGVTRAAGLIATLGDDKDNLFVILTARSMNPQLRIIARVEEERVNKEKLIKAGADRVISSNVIGGMRMASEMIRPRVATFLDQLGRVADKRRTVHFTELPLTAIKTPSIAALIEAQQQGETPLNPPLERGAYPKGGMPAGRTTETTKITIRDIGKHTGLLVVAIRSPEPGDHEEAVSRYHFTPRGETELHLGDVLVIVGTQDKLDEVTGRISDS